MSSQWQGRLGRLGRLRVMVLAVLCVMAGGGVFTGASAWALTGHAFSGVFLAGGNPSFPGGFSSPLGVGVDGVTGDVYVSDQGNGVIDRFDGFGVWQSQTVVPGGVGCLYQLAVDNSGVVSGAVYVANICAGLVYKFTPGGLADPVTPTVGGGVITQPTGVSVDGAGNVYVADFAAATVFKFNSLGVPDAVTPQIGAGQLSAPKAVAVDAAGNVYVANSTGVVEFNATGGCVNGCAALDGAGTTGVAVDPANGHVFSDDGDHVAEYDSSGSPVRDSAGQALQFGSGVLGGGYGLAINPGTSSVYVADLTGNTVDIFAAVVFADTVTGAALNLQTTTATLTGTVNPNGVAVTDCHFEYGADTSYGHSMPCVETPAQIGTGSASVAVHADITGLAPNTSYHYRLDASNANGASDALDQTLTSAPSSPVIPPPVTAVSTSPFTETLNASINPENSGDTTYHFQYGTTSSYGTITPQPDGDAGGGATALPVSATLTGLLPHTTYHYQLTAKNTQGTTATPDATFTTASSAPLLATGAPAGITQASATLTGTLNPEGLPTTYYFQWSTDLSYTTNAPPTPTDAGASFNPSPVSTTITGLTANTTYHYRLVASNSVAITYGTDQVLITPAYLPNILTGPPTAITQTTATLTGLLNPEGALTTYHIQYGPTTAYENTYPANNQIAGNDTQNTPIAINLTNLTPNSTYHYRLTATNTTGTSYGQDQTLTTPPYPPNTIQPTPTTPTPTTTPPKHHQPPKHKHNKKHKPKHHKPKHHKPKPTHK